MHDDRTPTTQREPDDQEDEITLPAVPKAKWGENRPGEMRCRHPGRQTVITEDKITMICDLIRTGCYNWVAAAKVGIGGTTFSRWVARGKYQRLQLDKATAEGTTHTVPDADVLFLKFYDELEQARASARYDCEIEVKKSNPLAWLRFGPGRERPGEPGWTDSSKVEITGKDGEAFNPGTAPVPIDPKKLTNSELADLRRLLEKAQPDESAD